MRATLDTNVLVRIATGDHPEQQAIAFAAIAKAELLAVPLPALCEFAWVMRRGYKTSQVEIAQAIRKLASDPAVISNRDAIEAGLAVLEAGGDFADGVIAFEGRRAGGKIFLSFDRKAVARINAAGGSAKCLS